jgi:hypothetical protein
MYVKKPTHFQTLGRKHGRGEGKDLFPLVAPLFVHVATLRAKMSKTFRKGLSTKQNQQQAVV